MDKKENKSFEEYEKKIESEFEKSTIFQTSDDFGTRKAVKSNNYVRLLSGLLCFAVVITGCIFAVAYLWPNEEVDDETTDDETESQYISLTETKNVKLEDMKNASKDAIAPVSEIYIKNETDEFTCLPFKATETDDDGEETETVNYRLKGVDKDIPISTAMVTDFSADVFEVEAISKLDTKYTEKDCGLDKPKILVEVTMADNSKFNIKVGNEVSTSDGYYYVSSSVMEGIYVASGDVYDNFSVSLNDLVDTSVVTALSADGDSDTYYTNGALTKYEKILINGSNFSKQVQLGYNESSDVALIYRITEPVTTYASDEKVTELLAPFNDGLVASTAYVVNPDEKDIKKYGLDNPYLDISYKIKGENYNLKLSKVGIKDNNYCACILNDIPVIYCISSDSVSFINWKLDDIRFSQLYLRNIDTLKSLSATFGGKTYKYDMSFDVVEETTTTNADGETETTASGDAETELTVIMNSSPVNSDDFKTVYQRIVMTSASKYLDIGDDGPDGKPYLTLRMEMLNGGEDEVITYTKYNENYYLFRLNGIGDELIPTRKVESLISNLKKLNKGEKVISPNDQQ